MSSSSSVTISQNPYVPQIAAAECIKQVFRWQQFTTGPTAIDDHVLDTTVGRYQLDMYSVNNSGVTTFPPYTQDPTIPRQLGVSVWSDYSKMVDHFRSLMLKKNIFQNLQSKNSSAWMKTLDEIKKKDLKLIKTTAAQNIYTQPATLIPAHSLCLLEDAILPFHYGISVDDINNATTVPDVGTLKSLMTSITFDMDMPAVLFARAENKSDSEHDSDEETRVKSGPTSIDQTVLLPPMNNRDQSIVFSLFYLHYLVVTHGLLVEDWCLSECMCLGASMIESVHRLKVGAFTQRIVPFLATHHQEMIVLACLVLIHHVAEPLQYGLIEDAQDYVSIEELAIILTLIPCSSQQSLIQRCWRFITYCDLMQQFDKKLTNFAQTINPNSIIQSRLELEQMLNEILDIMIQIENAQLPIQTVYEKLLLQISTRSTMIDLSVFYTLGSVYRVTTPSSRLPETDSLLRLHFSRIISSTSGSSLKFAVRKIALFVHYLNECSGCFINALENHFESFEKEKSALAKKSKKKNKAKKKKAKKVIHNQALWAGFLQSIFLNAPKYILFSPFSSRFPSSSPLSGYASFLHGRFDLNSPTTNNAPLQLSFTHLHHVIHDVTQFKQMLCPEKHTMIHLTGQEHPHGDYQGVPLFWCTPAVNSDSTHHSAVPSLSSTDSRYGTIRLSIPIQHLFSPFDRFWCLGTRRIPYQHSMNHSVTVEWAHSLFVSSHEAHGIGIIEQDQLQAIDSTQANGLFQWQKEDNRAQWTCHRYNENNWDQLKFAIHISHGYAIHLKMTDVQIDFVTHNNYCIDSSRCTGQCQSLNDAITNFVSDCNKHHIPLHNYSQLFGANWPLVEQEIKRQQELHEASVASASVTAPGPGLLERMDLKGNNDQSSASFESNHDLGSPYELVDSENVTVVQENKYDGQSLPPSSSSSGQHCHDSGQDLPLVDDMRAYGHDYESEQSEPDSDVSFDEVQNFDMIVLDNLVRQLNTNSRSNSSSTVLSTQHVQVINKASRLQHPFTWSQHPGRPPTCTIQTE